MKELIGRYIKILKNFRVEFTPGDYHKIIDVDREGDFYIKDKIGNNACLIKSRIHNEEILIMPEGWEPGQPVNLIGRYVQALIDAPFAGTVKKGEYGLILRDDGKGFVLDFPSQTGYYIDKSHITETTKILLMPVGFNPDVKEEWIPQVGDWVYAEKQKQDEFRDSEYIPIFQIKQIHDKVWLRPKANSSTGIERFNCRKATQAEIDAVTKKPLEKLYIDPKVVVSKKEDLLAEAKRRYPIGTKFKCAHIKEINDSRGSINGIFTVTNYCLMDKNKVHSGNGWLYFEGKWAEIVESPKTETLIITPIKGNYYVSKSSGNICRWGNGDSDYYLANGNIEFREGRGSFYYEDNELRYATPEEQLWLQTCIHYDRFLSRNSYEVEHAIKMGKCGEIKTEEKWQVGGYVRLREVYLGFPIGTIGQIMSKIEDTVVNVRLSSYEFRMSTASYGKLEWLGMEKPSQYPVWNSYQKDDFHFIIGIDPIYPVLPEECYQKYETVKTSEPIILKDKEKINYLNV